MAETQIPARLMLAEEPDLPGDRPCTRCDGRQHLVGAADGMGKYRCDVCEMVVGFDLQANPPEFLLHRGLASRYTKKVFGDRLLAQERRLGRADRLSDAADALADLD